MKEARFGPGGFTRGARSAKPMVLVALAALVAFAVAASSADAASPIHWWKADGNANDSVGTNNGTLQNGATFAAGESGQAFSLDGTSQYVSVPDDPSHYFSGSFTLDAWAKTTASTGGQFILSIYECGNSCPSGVANSAAELAVSDGQAYGFVRDSTGMGPDAGGQQVKAGPNVADGAWHHLVFIRDVAAGKLVLFVDDIKVADSPLASGAAGALHNDDGEADPLTIGAEITGGSSAPHDLFNGLIDDVKLFDSAAYPSTTTSQPTLTVSQAGTGSGTVTSSPTGISCPGTCSHSYASGTSVTLTATPASGSTLTGWSGGGCSGKGTCTVTMNADQSVTATFAPSPPNTKITNATIDGTASFKFKGSGRKTGFQCALVSKKHKKPKFKSCRSPKTYKGLMKGKYTFEVRAVGPGGPDPTPAKKPFKIS